MTGAKNSSASEQLKRPISGLWNSREIQMGGGGGGGDKYIFLLLFFSFWLVGWIAAKKGNPVASGEKERGHVKSLLA